jgi:hypothetical protein
MGNVYPIGDFTVVKSNPSGNIVRFTVTDTANFLTTSKMIRAVLCDAIQQWIDDERADLDTNADDAVKGAEDEPGVGDGFSSFTFVFGSKYSEVTLTALTSISTTGNITAEIPYADVS